MAECWRVSDPSWLSWREWDGEIVLYDGASGDVHRFEALAAETFEILLAAPATLPELASRVAASLELDNSPEFVDDVARVVRQLHLSGLFQPADAP